MIGNFIKSLIDSIPGFIFGILITWFSIKSQDRKQVQVHFRDHYIFEGFEKGLESLMLLREHFIKEHVPGAVHTADFDLPITPFLRIYDVIGCENIAAIAVIFRGLGQGCILGIPKDSTDTEVTLIDDLCNEMARAKNILVPYSYVRKPDFEQVRQMIEIKDIKDKIEDLAEKLYEIERSHYGTGFI